MLRERRPAELKLRVYNPGFEEHGWQSTHTVVEMVTDDMPFLVDSLVMELNRHGATIHFMVHAILLVVRDAQGLLIEIAGRTTKGARAESVIHVEIDRDTDPGEVSVLRDDLCRVLGDVRRAVEDRPAMRAALARAIETLSSVPSRVRYRAAFPAAYREDYTARHAVHDIARIEAALQSGTIELHLAQAGDLADDLLVFKLYHPAVSVTLSQILPMLENMGVTVLDDRLYEIRTAAGSVWIHAFRLRHNEAQGLDTDQISAKFQEAYALVWAGLIDNDGFNRLVLRARLDAFEILVLRAYARYLRQIGLTYTQSYVEDCLAGHPDTARALIGLFEARFDPRRKARAARVSALAAGIEEALEATTSLDEDRILRGPLTVIQATLRTNWFQRGPQGNASSTWPSSSIQDSSRSCRGLSRCSRRSCARPMSRPCTCAEARSRAAGSAGRTGARTSVPRCSGS